MRVSFGEGYAHGDPIDGDSPMITAAMENKLMAYQFALRLRCENYACDVGAIALDLKITDAK